jgi:hypothetical protein
MYLFGLKPPLLPNISYRQTHTEHGNTTGRIIGIARESFFKGASLDLDRAEQATALDGDEDEGELQAATDAVAEHAIQMFCALFRQASSRYEFLRAGTKRKRKYDKTIKSSKTKAMAWQLGFSIRNDFACIAFPDGVFIQGCPG